MLGVTRQFVDRLCDDGVLPYRRPPHSSHRRIKVRDVVEVDEDRQRRREGNSTVRAAMGI